MTYPKSFSCFLPNASFLPRRLESNQCQEFPIAKIADRFFGQESFALLSVFYSLQRYKITQSKTMKVTDPTESENPKGSPRHSF